MNSHTGLFFTCLCLCASISCGNKNVTMQASPKTEADTITTFTLPSIPTALKAPEARAEYLVCHYWDNINFADSNYVHHTDLMEQAWVNYIDLMQYVSAETSDKAIKSVFKSAEVQKKNFSYLVELADKYLYDPNSPMHNEELYITTLDAILTSDIFNDAEKIRWQHRRLLAQKNRLGTRAIDFTFTVSTGEHSTLYSLKAPFTLLYINDPSCQACQKILEELKNNELINYMLSQKKVAILSLYPYEDIKLWEEYRDIFPNSWIKGYDAAQTIIGKNLYDLKAMPTLYLLDADKIVLLKDATPAQIIQYLSNI